MVDEAETKREGKAQAKFFKKVELEFWRVLATIHNLKVQSREITGLGVFSDPAKLRVNISYTDQKPVMSRKEKIEELKMEVDAGFKSKKRAIRELNPHEDEELLLEEIMEERTVFVEELDVENDQDQQEV